MRLKSNRGFSLVELLIVVAIILVIAAIAIPNFLRSRMAANEAGAVQALRQIGSAEVAYSASNPQIGYTCSLSTLGPSGSGTQTYMLDPDVANGSKGGYTFALQNCTTSVSLVTGYQVLASPQSAQQGSKDFCSDQAGVIHADTPGNCDVVSSTRL